MHDLLSERAASRIRGSGRGRVFTPKDFADLASHGTARQILARLEAKGEIRRILRGVYEYPLPSHLLGGFVPPDPDAIARAIARTHGWTIHPTGAAALNALGLSTQVPARWSYLSDGPSRTYEWDGGTLYFAHRANRETSGLSPKTGLIVHALKALGREGIDDEALARIRRRTTAAERTRALREARHATSWIVDALRALAGEAATDGTSGGPRDARDRA